MNQSHLSSATASVTPGLVGQGTVGVRGQNEEKKQILSKSGLPVIPVKKVADSVVNANIDKAALANIKVKELNIAEERLKLKDDNERKILKEQHRRKQEIMKEVKNPRDQVEGAMFEEMRDFIKKHGRRQFFKYYLSTYAVTTGVNEASKFIQKRPLIDQLKFNNMYDQSLAEKKRIWVGQEGNFKKSDVQEWFKVWDETQLFNARKQVVDHDRKAVHH